uniref:CHAT domain-containing protein n=1 Tax=Candidatus Kentrum eta TaxID=2126337 RepID=A0A450U5G5_9GAMM|nr:MAG: CHAT domain-containing protein [Candidatus Kentron sp. H]VFJ88271.1 MAG: CHAT domain-containing protein [Candidatus Kentron sp. H]VFJ95493.1 MAG: CHAT domain-containing protein [Candidatus Kentron sp. H]
MPRKPDLTTPSTSPRRSTKKQLEELRWYLEEYIRFPGAGDRVRAGKLERNLDQWGRRLFETIFAGDEGRRIADSLMEGAQAARNGDAGDKKAPMLTIASTEVAILAQPWELMRDQDGLLALRGVTIRRQLRETKTLPRYHFRLPLRILLIVARPDNAGFIDPRNSIPPILDAVESLPGKIQVDFCEPPTFEELQNRIRAAKREGRPYHIIHFDGHGSMMEIDVPNQPVTEMGVLCFENDANKIDPVRGLILGKLLSENHVPVVILEACRGAYLSDQPAYASVAPALLQSGVGSVVAFSHTVHVEAARILVARFYAELVKGASVGRAVDEARAALRDRPQRWLSRGPDAETLDHLDWFIPQLYQAGDDPVLLNQLAARNDAAPPRGAENDKKPAWKRWVRAIGWGTPTGHTLPPKYRETRSP